MPTIGGSSFWLVSEPGVAIFIVIFIAIQIVKGREKEQPKPLGVFLLCVFLEETIDLSSLVAKLVKSLQ